MKKVNIILILSIAALAAVIIIFIVTKKPRLSEYKNPLPIDTGGDDNGPAITPPVYYPPNPNPINPNTANGGFPLKRNSRGLEVKLLQVGLGVTADGIFGANTELAAKNRLGTALVTASQLSTLLFPAAAVSNYPLQRGNRGLPVQMLQLLLGVTADGIFGANTEAKVKSILGKTIVTMQDAKNLYQAKLGAGAGDPNWTATGGVGVGGGGIGTVGAGATGLGAGIRNVLGLFGL